MAIKPDRALAIAVDARMRARLADSLRELASQAESALSVSTEALAAACLRITNAPVAPSIFGAYCELVFALQGGDMETATTLFAEIARCELPPPGIRIQAFADPRKAQPFQRYERLYNTDPEQAFAIRPPSPPVEQACRLRIAAALQLLAEADPEAHAELHALLREIILGVGDPDSKLSFDGASSFMLFGAILLNAEGHDTVLQTLEALVHESSHNLLFGLCADGALIENDDDERFDSPLRADQRPMDGIVHASFVLARMHQAIQRLLDSGKLTPDQRSEADAMLASSAQHYQNGRDVIERHARLTPLGQRIMAGAHTYMTPYLDAAIAKPSAAGVSAA